MSKITAAAALILALAEAGCASDPVVYYPSDYRAPQRDHDVYGGVHQEQQRELPPGLLEPRANA